MVRDLVATVGQDRIEVITLIKEELDPHTYELVKGDDEKLLSADLVFITDSDLSTALISIGT